MKLNLNYGKKEGKPEGKPQDITRNIIFTAFQSRYKDGLDGQLRRIVGRIQRKLDEAKDNVDFETAELELIQKTIQEAKLPPLWSAEIMVLEDELENCTKEDKKE